MLSDHKKSLVMIRYWMLGRGMHLALKAMEYAIAFHRGTRKDGITPEFAHQVAIVSYLRTLEKELDDAEATLAAAWLHDTPEDYDIGYPEILSQFGAVVCTAVQFLTKKHRGKVIDPSIYYDRLSEDNIASVVKGADRIHNQQSMVGVFSVDKQKEYMSETKDQILPMLKRARKKFTQQEAVYENEKTLLTSQISLITAIHAAK